MRNSSKLKNYDYVAHITYKLCPEVKDTVFYKEGTKNLHKITSPEGVELVTKEVRDEVISYLESFDYKIENIVIPAPKVFKAKKNLSFDCVNSKCLYFDELYQKQCKIAIHPTVEFIKERIRGTSKKRTVRTNIVITFTARDIAELNKKTDCIIAYFMDNFGIMGEPDVYGKLELC